MALNFTQRSFFQMEFSGSCNTVGEQLDTEMHGLIRDFGISLDSNSNENREYAEILRLLPDDPFNMDVTTATFTAFSEWLEGFKGDTSSNIEGSILDIVWDNLDSYFSSAVCLSTDPTAAVIYEESYAGSFKSIPKNTYMLTPHDAIFLAIGHLELVDLLSVERVCWSLNIAVKGDPLLWKNIHIAKPLSEKVNDDVLLKLTSRAQGNLLSLSVVESLRITDSGLNRVFQANPRLKKLSVPGCVRLSINCLMGNIRAQKGAGRTGITHLQINGIFGVTTACYEELLFLLGVDSDRVPGAPRFYHVQRAHCPGDAESALDIERCSRCGDVKVVYDCPTAGCRAVDDPDRPCRGCIMCVSRCVHCGRCIKDRFYEETFFLDLLCYDCQRYVSP